jgi:hypothetical protein
LIFITAFARSNVAWSTCQGTPLTIYLPPQYTAVSWTSHHIELAYF